MPFSRIGPYAVERLVGLGGMGEVYLARDERLNRPVAVKLLPVRYTQDPDRVRRFQREARAASSLNHPNIVTIYDIGESDEGHYIATEYVDGITVRTRIDRGGMTLREVLDIAIGTTEALAAAHAAGIIHRDVKPENVMIRGDGYVKVLDFGLAKLLDDASGKDSGTGSVIGTLLYISPEQARAQTLDARTDLFSVGVLIYEMLTGVSPFEGESLLDVAFAIANRDPLPPHELAPAVPPALDAIVMKLLRKDREERYQSAVALLEDLRAIRGDIDLELRLSDGRRPRPVTESDRTAILSSSARLPAELARVARRRRIAGWAASAAVAIVLIAVLVTAFRHLTPPADDATLDSVAVLPLTNGTANPDSEYLSDGISESIIDSLSQLPKLHVIARSTAFRYRGKNVDPLVVGRDLKVRAVVTGELLERADTVIVRVALTDTRRGIQLWGEQYDRKMSDVLSVQREISHEISEKLQRRLSGDDQRRIARASTTDSRAFELYLKGRFYTRKFSEEDLRRAIASFEEAIRYDPHYALAYSGLADVYYTMSNLWAPPSEAMPRMRAAAEAALANDESLAEAHASMGMELVWYEWDFDGGEAQFRRAIELNPSYADAHRRYGDFLTAMGRFEEAIAEKSRAVQLDPLSPVAVWDLARTYMFAGDTGRALEMAKRVEELDPNFAGAYLLRTYVENRTGRYKDALADIRRAIAVSVQSPLLHATECYTEALAGDREAALQCRDDMRNRPSTRYTSPVALARIEIALGNREDAMRLLQKGLKDRSESLVWLKVDRTLDALRNDPRFPEMEHAVGLR